MSQRPAAVSAIKLNIRFKRLVACLILCLCAASGWNYDAAAAGDCTTPNFGPPAIYGVGAVRSIAVADFDVDGKTDLIALNGGNSGTFNLLLGDGTGAFPTRGAYAQKGRAPNAIAAGDFNNDGRPDVVIANGISVQGDASVFLNNDLHFDQAIPVNWTSPGTIVNTTSVAVADFNSDGKLDLVATNIEFHGVSVALGDGTGHFTNRKGFNTGGTFPQHVVARDFNGDGKPDVAVANSGSGGGNVGILLGDGAGSFGTPTAYAAGVSPLFIAAGDFNSDNKADLAVVSNGTASNVAILLGDGAGAFGAPANYSTGGRSPYSIAAADFNGDGKTDLAVANQQSANVGLLNGDGAGNFQLTAAYDTGAGNPNVVVAPDLNGDAKPDLVLGHQFSRRVAVLLNNCGAPESTPTLNINNTSYTVFERDGIATITVNRNGALAGAATVDYATSDGTALNPSDYKATTGTLSFAEGEASKSFTVEVVNDDLDEPSERFNVTLSNATGAAVLGTLNAATVDILDDDPIPSLSVNDVSVAEGNSGSRGALFTVSLSAASGQQVQVNYATSDLSAKSGVDYTAASGTLTFAPGETSKVVAVAINGDNLAEVNEDFQFTLTTPVNATIADAQGVATILEDDATCPNPTFGAVTNVAAPSPVALVVGDFNSDGKLDVATADSDFGNVNVRLGDGAGAFGAEARFHVGGTLRSMALGDFNLDGKTDIAVSRMSDPSGVSILLGNGAGGFAPPTNVNTGPLPSFVAVGDFNSDGKPDLMVVSLDPGAISVQLGDGQGSFGPPVRFFAVYSSPQRAVLRDFDGDGKLDVAVSNMNSNNIAVALGDGTGSFTGMFTYPVGEYPVGISAGDFNGDGKTDLAVANSGSHNVSLLLSQGEGRFGPATNFATGVRPLSLAAADLNGDGRLDVVTTNFQADPLTDGNVSVLFGTGEGRFTQPTNFATGRGPNNVIVNDLNGDAKGDLVVTNLVSGNFSVLLNACAGAPAPSSTLQFSAPNVQRNEGDERATFTVTRTGDTSGTATVDYRTNDTDTFTVGCFDAAGAAGSAYARCDFATVVGTLSFNPGETSKTITVPLIDDGHAEGSETFQLLLSNVAGATLGTPGAATITITDNDSAGAQNPVVASFPFFVRQQYLDFLSREPDQGGFHAWLGVLNGCPNAFTGPNVPSQCDRIYVSGEGFFRSQEFQLKGFYVFRFYRLAFNRLPEYTEIVSDMSFVAGQTAEEVYARKAQLATRITARQEFQTAYSGMTNEQYVNTLLARYGLTQVTTPDPAQPDASAKVTLTSTELANRLTAGTLTRAQVLRAVADSDEVGAREFNNAFVGMQYYGYLRRKPDEEGFQAWLRVLQAGDVRTMVDGFLNSVEYKLRFGQP